MTNQKGSISIHTENIFPIIKKWLYSDKDIFIRELISNGCDAVNKYKKLISLGEAKGNTDENYKIKVSIDKENSALIFEDNGIGMTAEEVEKYINQVAFSGAEDFFNTYKDKMNEENDIIGHFGLGFYSSFMVSKKVQIDTLSYKENATPVRWVSEDGLEFELTQSDNRETRGTTITLFLADDSKEFLEEYTVRNIIDKYCSFLPVDIYLETIKTEETKEDEVVDTTPINDTNPLWLKAPKDCTDEEYKEFYMPKNKPQIVTIPKANYIAVRGKGNPNEEGGEYKTAIGVLYAVAYTLKMSYKTDYKIEGFFEYVVPPLEGFWWQDNVESIDYTDKSAFNWISVIRLPDFIAKKDFDWAVETASKKKKMDCSGAEFLSIDEGLCVQIMHIGAFDDEPATVTMMDKYLEENGYVNDFTDERRHHEIYLSDPRKVAPEKCKTVIRHPIKKA